MEESDIFRILSVMDCLIIFVWCIGFLGCWILFFCYYYGYEFFFWMLIFCWFLVVKWLYFFYIFLCFGWLRLCFFVLVMGLVIVFSEFDCCLLVLMIILFLGFFWNEVSWKYFLFVVFCFFIKWLRINYEWNGCYKYLLWILCKWLYLEFFIVYLWCFKVF